MPQDFTPEISEYFSCLQEWDASYEEYAKSVGLSYTSLALLSAIYGSESRPSTRRSAPFIKRAG